MHINIYLNLFTLLLLPIACSLAFSPSAADEFESFVAQYGKNYASFAEYSLRRSIYQENVNRIAQLNVMHPNTEFAVNKFADLTAEEFKKVMLMKPIEPQEFPASRYAPSLNQVELPDSFNWNDEGAVTPVKNQGSLGTCWAFSTVGNIEGQLFLQHNISDSLSVEQLVECDNNNCAMFGGWPYLSFEYIMRAGGIVSDTFMPYCAGIPLGKPGSCSPCMPQGYNKTLCGDHSDLYCNATMNNCPNVTPSTVSARVKDWVAISSNETDIQSQLYQRGPLSVLLNASELQFYRGGIFDPLLCNPSNLDHAVLLVGYGTEKNTPYWTVKNSWGADWGQKGFFQMVRGKGKCGINTMVTTSEIY